MSFCPAPPLSLELVNRQVVQYWINAFCPVSADSVPSYLEDEDGGYADKRVQAMSELLFSALSSAGVLYATAEQIHERFMQLARQASTVEWQTCVCHSGHMNCRKHSPQYIRD